MRLKGQEIRLKGTPLSRGIAIGRPFFFSVIETAIPDFPIHPDEMEKEITRYRNAVANSRADVRRLQIQLEHEGATEGAAILDAHLQMMQDPLVTTKVEKDIRSTRRNAESVFLGIIKKYEEKFNRMTDPVFRERFRDIQDISRRIMGYLRDSARVSLADIPRNSIVFAHELVPSDTAEAKRSTVSAFVTETGGATSHAAIVAKAKGIPYVAGVDFRYIDGHADGMVIVDGRTGDIIFRPTAETLAEYQGLQKQQDDHFRKLEEIGSLEAETYDGYKIRLSANVEMINELEMLHQYGGSGVGLFRSEYIFLAKDNFPSEEEQFTIYRRMVKKMDGLPIVIRTFDVGGDKFSASQQLPQEGNPFLGCRAIRFLLKERDIFKTQLRAILRASAYGDVSIMFPMVSSLPELIEAKKIVEEAREELERKGEKMGARIRIGCMIEVPSAAIISDHLAKQCDFLSIGTNDLVQYSLAVDRSNNSTSQLYSPMHPGIIRLIKLVISQAGRYGVPVTVCGEVAADPRFTPLLIGLGIHELSVASRYLPVVKNAIRNTSFVDAYELAEQALALTTSNEIQELLTDHYRSIVPEDSIFN